MQPNAPFLTRQRAETWLSSQTATVLPSAAPAPPAESPAFRLALCALRVIAVLLLVLLLALWFFLFGEERPNRVRPALTPAQRASAFRLPAATATPYSPLH